MHLIHKTSGAVTENLDDEGGLYQQLAAMRTTAGKPVWEGVSEVDISSAASRVLVLSDTGAALAADSVVASRDAPGRPGTITSAAYVPKADVVGADTNSRTVTVTQDAVTGTSSPVRSVTTLATLAMVAAAGTAAKGQPKAMTINNAAFNGDVPLKVVSTHVGTGIVDPGGLVLLTYTPA